MSNKKKKKTLREEITLGDELDNQLKEFEKYLKKIRKKNPKKPTEYERQTAELFYRMGKTMGEILSGITTTKESITTQTIVVTLGFIGLGILMAIGFNALS